MLMNQKSNINTMKINKLDAIDKTIANININHKVKTKLTFRKHENWVVLNKEIHSGITFHMNDQIEEMIQDAFPNHEDLEFDVQETDVQQLQQGSLWLLVTIVYEMKDKRKVF